MPTISVVIVSWNGERFLEPCLSAVLAQTLEDYEIIVVDNGSTDGSVELVRSRFPGVRLIENKRNLGYAGGANVGFQSATGEVLALLNQDTVPHPDWLAELLAVLDGDKEIGIVGSKILSTDGVTLQHAGAYLPWPLVQGIHYGRGEKDEGQYNELREVDYVTGAAMAIKRPVLEAVGLFDEGFFPGYFEDVDLCFRARQAGYRVVYVPRAVVLHHESSSFEQTFLGKPYLVYRSRIRFILKHYTPEQITEEFLPAEVLRLKNMGAEELRALASSCIEGLLMWPRIIHLLAKPLKRVKVESVIETLRALHNAAMQQELEILRR